MRSGVSELQLPCFTAVRAEIALMSGGAFAVTHHPVSSGAGRTSDGNGSHASTLKSPSYTKSVSWQHYRTYVNPAAALRFHSGCWVIAAAMCTIAGLIKFITTDDVYLPVKLIPMHSSNQK
uniref:Transposase n=2 Tax=Escherichia coli TaxID=562 RepID=A0A649Z3Y5_ECOLX|nr:hypothetical protein [Escherichia coli]